MSNEATAQKILLSSTLVVEQWKGWCGNCGHGDLDLPYGIPGNGELDACPHCDARWLYSASTYYYGTLEETKQHIEGVYPKLHYIGIAERGSEVSRMLDHHVITLRVRPYAAFVELYV